MNYAQDKAYGKQHYGLFKRVEPKRRQNRQAEPTAEKHAPDYRRDAAQSKYSRQVFNSPFHVRKTHDESAGKRKHKSVSRVRRHHAENYKEENRHDAVRVFFAIRRRRIHIGNAFERFNEFGVVKQSGRNLVGGGLV